MWCLYEMADIILISISLVLLLTKNKATKLAPIVAVMLQKRWHLQRWLAAFERKAGPKYLF